MFKVFDLTQSRQQQIPIFILFDLTRSGLKSTIYRTRDKHANHHTTDTNQEGKTKSRTIQTPTKTGGATSTALLMVQILYCH